MFHLPYDVIRIIFQYLSLSDISRVDSAVLNHETRDTLLKILDNMIIPEYISLDTGCRKKDCLDWLLLRNIRPLEITVKLFHPLMLHLIINSRFHLKLLDLRTEILDEYLRQIRPCPNLEKVVLWSCEITAERFSLFLKQHQHLKSLSLDVEFTLSFASAIANNCPNLTSLDVSYCDGFNDAYVLIIAQGCRKLMDLDISGTEVTSDSVQIIFDILPNLRSISLSACDVSNDLMRRCLRQVALPSLTSADPETQVHGLCCISENIVGVSAD